MELYYKVEFRDGRPTVGLYDATGVKVGYMDNNGALVQFPAWFPGTSNANFAATTVGYKHWSELPPLSA